MFHPIALLRQLTADLAFHVGVRANGERLLRRSAERLGVASFGCDSPLGFFQGSSRDRGVLWGLIAERRWAPEVQAILRDTFVNGGTLIDVGANIGLTSIPIAKARPVDCHAFEPDPENYRYLLSNIAANAATRVRPYNIAAMAEEGVLSFERSVDNMGDHRVRVGGGAAGAFQEQRREVIEVEGKRLDTLLSAETLATPIVLKVDTQGAEVHVLRGAAALLSRVDVAILEYWPYGLRRLGTTARELHELIAAFPVGAVLGTGPGRSEYDGTPRFVSTASLIDEMRRHAPDDGVEIDWVDIVLRRTAPGAA